MTIIKHHMRLLAASVLTISVFVGSVPAEAKFRIKVPSALKIHKIDLSHGKVKIETGKGTVRINPAHVAAGGLIAGVPGAAIGASTQHKDVKAALKHVEKEAVNAAENVVEAVDTIARVPGKFVENAADVAEKAVKQIRAGKPLDAVWTMYTAQYRVQEKTTYYAVDNSSLIRTAASVSIGSVAGPGGSAAFSAWYAYRKTDGNLDAALKSGLIAAGSSVASGSLASKGADAYATMLKASAGASVGAAGAYIAGGDDKTARDAALKGAAMALIIDAYRSSTGHRLIPKASKGEAYCKADDCLNYPRTDLPPRTADGRVDWSKIDVDRPHVGKFSGPNDSGLKALVSEKAAFMTLVSRLPGMNQMAVMHDMWYLPTVANELTIPLATAIVYAGTSAPIVEHSTKIVVQKKQTPQSSPAKVIMGMPQNCALRLVGRISLRNAVKLAATRLRPCPVG